MRHQIRDGRRKNKKKGGGAKLLAGWVGISLIQALVEWIWQGKNIAAAALIRRERRQ